MDIENLLAQTADGETLDILKMDREMRLAIARYIAEYDGGTYYEGDGKGIGQPPERQPKMGKIIPFGEPRKNTQ